MSLQDYTNRLVKTHRHLKKWATRVPTDCFRVYDRDIPQMPFIVELFGPHAVIWERIAADHPRGLPYPPDEIVAATATALGIEQHHVHYKVRSRMPGANQYTKLASECSIISVQEGPVRFLVNLTDYLDTGLFLDHRPLRLQIATEQPPVAPGHMLNLFCYTGSVSVAAAHAGYTVTSMDLSATYLSWAQENFRHNGIDPHNHRFIRAEILGYLSESCGERFDLIFLDPPSFSNSKRMEGHLDIVELHPMLITAAVHRLTAGGKLIFSTNKRKFKLSEEVRARYQMDDMTASSIPQDFTDKKIHQCFVISKKP